MPKYDKKAMRLNAHFNNKHGVPKENNKSTKISKAKKGYKKRK